MQRPSTIAHPARKETRGICIHNTYGSKPGDLATLDGPSVDCHFYVAKDGSVTQFVDTDLCTWTAMWTANHTCLHIETEGKREVAWTVAQHRSVVSLCRWLCTMYKIPVRKVDPPGSWLGLFDHRDLQGIDGNDHGDGVPISWPGWDRLIADIRTESKPKETAKPPAPAPAKLGAKPLTLYQRLRLAKFGDKSARRIISLLKQAMKEAK